MNFYQNQIWKKISRDIFKKEVFDYELFGKKYWWVKKTHKKLWIKFNWYQILWITIPENVDENVFKNELKKIKKDFSSLNDIFFQLGFINNLPEPFFENRKNIELNFETNYWLYPSVKENMPCATVIVDLKKSDDELFKNFSKSAKRNIKKAEKENLYFTIADEKDIDNFYNLWEKTAKWKWFNIYPKNQYKKLLDYLRSSWNGNLYLVKKDDVIISWSIEINEWINSYYLYWATNRDHIKIWWHYFLKYEMFKYLKSKWIEKVDLLWVSPNWYKNHHLLWVSQFKHSLWWEHIEYFWNFDLPLNKLWYKLLSKLYRK